MNKRTDTEILKDLVEAVREYNSLRDDEWDFDDNNGNRDFWSEDVINAHEELLNTIRRKEISEISQEKPVYDFDDSCLDF